MSAIDTLKTIIGVDEDIFADIVPYISKLINLGMNPAYAAYSVFKSIGGFSVIEMKLMQTRKAFPLEVMPEENTELVKSYLIDELGLESHVAERIVYEANEAANIAIKEEKIRAKKKAIDDLFNDFDEDDLGSFSYGIYKFPREDLIDIIEDGKFSKWLFNDNKLDEKIKIRENPENYCIGRGYSGCGDDPAIIVTHGQIIKLSGSNLDDIYRIGAKFGEPITVILCDDTLLLVEYKDFYVAAIRDLD